MQKSNIDFHYPDNSFYFSYREIRGPFTMVSNHFHNQYELYYLLSGERYCFVKDTIFHINPGSLVLINKNDLHKTKDAGTEAHSRLVINFSSDFVSPSIYMNNLIDELFRKNNYVITFLPADRKYVENLLFRISHEIQNKSTGFEIALQSILMELLIYTRRYIEEHQTNILANPTPMHNQIFEIVQYMNSNFSSNLSLSFISEKFFISQYYLSRTFKEATGFTFIEYVNSIRIREAQHLLIETNSKIINIAENVGFGNISHFGRVFKSLTGFSPLNYRKLYQR